MGRAGLGQAYRHAGVDIDAADRWLARLRPLIRSTHGPEVLQDRGQFAGLFRLAGGRWRDPVLVASADGVGTKGQLAQRWQAHESIGVDAVAMNTNDVVTYGARPLFFLDYIATGRVQPRVLTGLLRGIARGCKLSGCALLGGETAEMPGVLGAADYDVAGFCVGVAERRGLIDGSRVRAGDAVVGLASSGLHANGFSLVRKALTPAALQRLRRGLMVPTRVYVKPILSVVRGGGITAITHITGGGLARRLPSLVATQRALRISWAPGTWPVPRLFREIQDAGRLENREMYATFNMGLGMVLTCRGKDRDRVIRGLRRYGLRAWTIGTVESRHARRIARGRS